MHNKVCITRCQTSLQEPIDNLSIRAYITDKEAEYTYDGEHQDRDMVRQRRRGVCAHRERGETVTGSSIAL